jgi:hypothetical protein
VLIEMHKFSVGQIVLFRPDRNEKSPLLMACPPNGLSLTQLIRMFLQSARNRAAELQWPATMALLTMLRQNFPCRGWAPAVWRLAFDLAQHRWPRMLPSLAIWRHSSFDAQTQVSSARLGRGRWFRG